MPQLVIITQRKEWAGVAQALVRVPKKLTVHCQERGPLDVIHDHLVHLKFCKQVEPGLRKDLLDQLREHFRDTEASDLPTLYDWVKNEVSPT